MFDVHTQWLLLILAQSPHYLISTPTSLPGVVLTGGHSAEGISSSVVLKQP